MSSLGLQGRELYDNFLAEHRRGLDIRVDEAWKSANPPTIKNLGDRDWWVVAREKVVGIDPNDRGSGYCADYVRRMAVFLEDLPPGLELRTMYSLNRDHWWLEISDPYTEVTGLFDGTAGQLRPSDASLQDGLYADKTYALASNVGNIYSTGIPKKPDFS